MCCVHIALTARSWEHARTLLGSLLTGELDSLSRFLLTTSSLRVRLYSTRASSAEMLPSSRFACGLS